MSTQRKKSVLGVPPDKFAHGAADDTHEGQHCDEDDGQAPRAHERDDEARDEARDEEQRERDLLGDALLYEIYVVVHATSEYEGVWIMESGMWEANMGMKRIRTRVRLDPGDDLARADAVEEGGVLPQHRLQISLADALAVEFRRHDPSVHIDVRACKHAEACEMSVMLWNEFLRIRPT